MKQVLFALLGVVLLFACQKPSQKSSSATVDVASNHIVQKMGGDCDKADSLQTDCCVVDLSFPEVRTDNKALRDAVKTWANHFITGMLDPSISGSIDTVNLETGIKRFIDSHMEFKKDAPDFPGSYAAETSDSVLFNDGKYLTLAMTSYSFTGGAHGSHGIMVNTFDVATGKMLDWRNMVTDTVAFAKLVEQKVKKERADVFNPTEPDMEPFKFDESFPFSMPNCVGLKADGLEIRYAPYEIFPYAFGTTEFTLTKAELGKLLKI
jgi:Deacetylase PdaC/Protein of unknown function (DUF3298)